MFSADIALVDSGNGILLRRVNKGGKKEKGERLSDSDDRLGRYMVSHSPDLTSVRQQGRAPESWPINFST